MVSDTPNCRVTYDRHYDNRNSFIIQASGSNPISFLRNYRKACPIKIVCCKLLQLHHHFVAYTAWLSTYAHYTTFNATHSISLAMPNEVLSIKNLNNKIMSAT